MGFNHGLVSSIKFSKYSSCMTKLIVVKHFPGTYMFFYTCITDVCTQGCCIPALTTKCVVKPG